MEKRSVTIVTAVYPPEPVVSGRMAQDLATHLSQQGINVTVISPQPSRPIGCDYGNLKNPKKHIVINDNGVEIIRLPSYSAPESRIMRRFREGLSFGRYVCQYIKSQPQKPDALFVNAWPIVSQALILNYAKRKKIKVVLQIMDVYPESLLIKLPRCMRSITKRILTGIDKWTAQSATSIVVISEDMRRLYIEQRGIRDDKIVTINLWQDESLFSCLPRRKEGCYAYAISEEKFTFLFLGNIGPVAGVEFLIQAFQRAQIRGAQLFIAGDGSSKASCLKLAADLDLVNTQFLSDPDVRNTSLIQCIAHVCLLPVKPGAGLSSIPSKLIAYMLSAKPVLATVDSESETAKVIKAAGCGWVGQPEDLNWLANMMGEVAILPAEELEKIGEKGRQFCLGKYSKTSELEKLSTLIISACPGANNLDV